MFHVPNAYRVIDGIMATTPGNGNNGCFKLDSPEPGWQLAIIASDGADAPERLDWQWEHVSVHSYRDRGRDVQLRTPTWREMSFVKDLFWDAEDVVMQLHPRRSEYVNNHPHTLHLWRPKLETIPTPPAELVGIR